MSSDRTQEFYYSDEDLLVASTLAYDDYGIVEQIMVAGNFAESREYTIGEIYEFAMDPENNCQQYVQWTTLGLEDGSLELEDFQDWILVDYSDPRINKKEGFAACVFETSPGHAIVACRGSEGIFDQFFQDWADGFRLPFSYQTKHQNDSEDYAQHLAEIGLGEKYPYIAVAGHSLGGSDAEQFTVVAKKYGLEIDQCFCFDSPGNSLAHIQEYQDEFDQVSDVKVYFDYSWGSSGGLRYDGAHIVRGQRKPEGTYLATPDDFLNGFPQFFISHSPFALTFDEQGNVVEQDADEFGVDDYFYLDFHVLSWLPAILSLLRPDFLLHKDLEFLSKLLNSEPATNYLTLSGESSTNTREAQTEMTDWLGKQLMEHFSRVGRSNADYGEYLNNQAQGPSIRSLVSASGISDRLSMPEGSRRRDFSDATRDEMLAIIDGLLTDAPLDASHYVEWDEFERECKRLVPEAFPYFQSMLDFNDTFEQNLKASKAEINRIFDEAIAIDSAHAEKISGINDQLRQLKEGLHEMTTSLETASAKIGSIGWTP